MCSLTISCRAARVQGAAPRSPTPSRSVWQSRRSARLPVGAAFSALRDVPAGPLFPYLPKQPGYSKRMRALGAADRQALERARLVSPSWGDTVRLLDSPRCRPTNRARPSSARNSPVTPATAIALRARAAPRPQRRAALASADSARCASGSSRSSTRSKGQLSLERHGAHHARADQARRAAPPRPRRRRNGRHARVVNARAALGCCRSDGPAGLRRLRQRRPRRRGRARRRYRTKLIRSRSPLEAKLEFRVQRMRTRTSPSPVVPLT
jgi:hypothetical protein